MADAILGQNQKENTCRVDGCSRVVYGNGLCRPHNRRNRLYGDPLGKTVRVVDGTPHKECPHCGELKSTAEFHKCSSSATGLHTYCKRCTAMLRKQRYQKLLTIKCKVPGCNRGIVQKSLGICAMHR